MRLKNLEIQGASYSIEIDGDKKSDLAGVFESIRVINQEIKDTMREEMKLRGLTDDDIRYVFHIDKD